MTLANRNGDTALHRACWSGNLEVLQDLVDYGALIDEPNYNGLTPRRDGNRVKCSDGGVAGGISEDCGVSFEPESQYESAGVSEV